MNFSSPFGQKVFLCYSTSDCVMVQQIVADLRHHGIEVYCADYDMDLGADILAGLHRKIGESDGSIIFISEHSVRSEWISREVTWALAEESSGKTRIIIARISPCELPRELNAVSPLLGRYRYVDFVDDYAKALKVIVGTLQGDDVLRFKYTIGLGRQKSTGIIDAPSRKEAMHRVRQQTGLHPSSLVEAGKGKAPDFPARDSVGTFNFKCSHCAASLSATPDQVGSLASCPHCGKETTVPPYINFEERPSSGESPSFARIKSTVMGCGFNESRSRLTKLALGSLVAMLLMIALMGFYPTAIYILEYPFFVFGIMFAITGGRAYAKNKMASVLSVQTAYGFNYLVKIYGADNGKIVALLIIQGGNTMNQRLPFGRYRIKYALGRNWRNVDELFGAATVFRQADMVFHLYKQGMMIHGASIMLYPFAHEMLNTFAIPRCEF